MRDAMQIIFDACREAEKGNWLLVSKFQKEYEETTGFCLDTYNYMDGTFFFFDEKRVVKGRAL